MQDQPSSGRDDSDVSRSHATSDSTPYGRPHGHNSELKPQRSSGSTSTAGSDSDEVPTGSPRATSETPQQASESWTGTYVNLPNQVSDEFSDDEPTQVTPLDVSNSGAAFSKSETDSELDPSDTPNTEVNSPARAQDTSFAQPTGGNELDETMVAGVPPITDDASAELIMEHDQDLPVGTILGGRYRLEVRLMRRDETQTWRAFDEKLSRSVLLHVLPTTDPRSETVLHDARRAASATDSRFLRVLDAVPGNEIEPTVIVCEFAPGQRLEDLLAQGPLSAFEAAWLVREIADAMTPMHQAGMFHEQLNPDTIIITVTGNVKIVGFLIEAAFHPRADEFALTWSEREKLDVDAMGQLLYASLVGRWPALPTDPPPAADGTYWGIHSAPTDGHGYLTPRQVRSGISPALDMVCDQILSGQPNHHDPPIRTASEVLGALNKILHNADASPDLERRLRYPGGPSSAGASGGTGFYNPSATARAATPQSARAAAMGQRPSSAMDETMVATAVGPAIDATQRWDAVNEPPVEEPSGETSTPPSDTARPTQVEQLNPAGRRRPRSRRWLVTLLGLLFLTAVAGVIALLIDTSIERAGGGGEAANADQPYEVSSVQDFDPEADGGSNDENPNQVSNVTDGDPTTSWKTVTYYNDPKLGRLKPGVGVVLDLGQEEPVSSVELELGGSPSAVGIYVPKESGQRKAPTNTINDWTEVAADPKAGAKATLTLEEPVTTRFVLVYFTSLPNVGGTDYRGELKEVVVKS